MENYRRCLTNERAERQGFGTQLRLLSRKQQPNLRKRLRLDPPFRTRRNSFRCGSIVTCSNTSKRAGRVGRIGSTTPCEKPSSSSQLRCRSTSNYSTALTSLAADIRFTWNSGPPLQPSSTTPRLRSRTTRVQTREVRLPESLRVNCYPWTQSLAQQPNGVSGHTTPSSVGRINSAIQTSLSLA